MRRVGGRWWVQGVGYAYRRWWILRLVRRCMVICAPSAPGCGTGLLAATADTPLFSFSKSRLRSVALTLLGQSQLAVYSSYYYDTGDRRSGAPANLFLICSLVLHLRLVSHLR